MMRPAKYRDFGSAKTGPPGQAGNVGSGQEKVVTRINVEAGKISSG